MRTTLLRTETDYRRSKARGAWTALVLATVTLLAACSTPGNSNEGKQGGTSSGGSSPTQATSVELAQAALAANYKGTDGPVPADGPPAATGKSIWVITCGQAAAGCATPGNAVVEAAKAIGWHHTLCDGKLNPSTYAQCVATAAAAHPDAIVLVAVDCQFVSAPLKKAKAEGIKIFGVNSFDCSSQGAKDMFDGQVVFHGFDSFQAYVEQGLGKSIANYLIATSEGKANVLLVRENDNLSAKANTDGIEAQLGSCSGCTTQTLQITVNDLISGTLADKVTAALNKYPNVTAVAAPYDAAITFGIAQGVAKTGREVTLTGLEGLPANIGLIKKGTQTMAGGTPAGWVGWAAIDGLNRLLAGKPLVDEGIGIQTVDAKHNLPATTPFYDGNVDESGKPKQDYKAIYLASWGK